MNKHNREARLKAAVVSIREQNKSANTKRAYEKSFDDFVDWCRAYEREYLPASNETLTLYLTDISKAYARSTIEIRLAAINYFHIFNNLASPTKDPSVKEYLKGIRRSISGEQIQKKPLLLDTLRGICDSLGYSLLDKRDKALLLLGFAGAFRRSELVALNRSDLEFETAGLRVTIRKSKVDQQGRGRQIGIPASRTSVLDSVKEWLAVNQGSDNPLPLFRSLDRHGNLGARLSAQSVAKIIKKRCSELGIDPDNFSGHSLRAGLATQAAIDQVPERIIQKQTGHKHLPTLRRYIRDGELFNDNALNKIDI